MRNLIFIVFCLFITYSCSKEDQPEPTTYQILNAWEKTTSEVEYLDGSIYEVVVFCYNDKDEIIREDNFAVVNSGGGRSEKKPVTENIVKVKVSFKFLPPQSPLYDLSSNVRKYLVTINYLTPGTNNEIVITENTMIKNTISIVEKDAILP